MELEKLRINLKNAIKRDLMSAIIDVEKTITPQSIYYDEIIILHAQLIRIRKEYLQETIQHESYNSTINKVTKAIIVIINQIAKEDLVPVTNAPTQMAVHGSKANVLDASFEKVGDGEFKNGNGEHKITIAPTVFFFNRITEAFPGVRGLRYFEGEKAIERLSLLLREPTSFDHVWGHGVQGDPVWWFRGRSGLPVQSFKVISSTKCLLNNLELSNIAITVHYSRYYYKCFVYVESKGELQGQTHKTTE